MTLGTVWFGGFIITFGTFSGRVVRHRWWRLILSATNYFASNDPHHDMMPWSMIFVALKAILTFAPTYYSDKYSDVYFSLACIRSDFLTYYLRPLGPTSGIFWEHISIYLWHISTSHLKQQPNELSAGFHGGIHSMIWCNRDHRPSFHEPGMIFEPVFFSRCFNGIPRGCTWPRGSWLVARAAVQALSKKEQILELFRTTEMKSSMDCEGRGDRCSQVGRPWSAHYSRKVCVDICGMICVCVVYCPSSGDVWVFKHISNQFDLAEKPEDPSLFLYTTAWRKLHTALHIQNPLHRGVADSSHHWTLRTENDLQADSPAG